MPPVSEDEADDVALIRRQARAALLSLLRPGTYLGTAREIMLTAVHVAAYPLGMSRNDQSRSREYRSPFAGEVADAETADLPVILLHGYVHNRSAFLAIGRALHRAGFRHVHAFDYNPLTHDVPEIAGMLAGEVERVLERTGAEKCMIVGHSMGGLIARYYVQQLGGEDTVDTLITMGSPHRGTYSAYLGWGAAATQMRPGSALMRKLEETARPSSVRWISYYSDLDFLVVPAASAKLVHPALQARNVKLANTGHLSFLMSGEVLRGLVADLVDRGAGRPEPVPEVTSLPTAAQRVRRSTAGKPTAQTRTSGA